MSLRHACALLAVLAVAGCASSTVSGQGSGGGGSAASSSSASSAPPVSSPVLEPSSSAESSSSVPRPEPAPTPDGCRSSDCRIAASFDLGAGTVIELRGNDSADGNVGAAYIELLQDGVPVAWHTLSGEYAGELTCNIAGSVRNCVVIDGAGAHAGAAYPVVVDGTTLHVGDPAISDTPIIEAADLDNDNRLDVRALQNDYTPAYANGHVYWQTLRRSSDGLEFISTGCGPKARSKPAEPTTLLTAPCPTG